MLCKSVFFTCATRRIAQGGIFFKNFASIVEKMFLERMFPDWRMNSCVCFTEDTTYRNIFSVEGM